MAKPISTITASLIPSSTPSTGAARSGAISISAMPKMSEKKIRPSMSPSAAAATGLRGTIFTKVLIPKPVTWEAATFSPASPEYSSSSSARTAGSSASPGRTMLTSVRPIVAASAVVARKKPRVRTPIRPTRLISPSEATPSASDVNTSGTTTMKSIRRKMFPTGDATLLVNHSSWGVSCQRMLQVTPAAAPRSRPIMILVCSGTPRRVGSSLINRPFGMSLRAGPCNVRQAITSRESRATPPSSAAVPGPRRPTPSLESPLLPGPLPWPPARSRPAPSGRQRAARGRRCRQRTC